MKKVILTDCFNTIICRKKSANDVIFSFAENIAKKYNIAAENIYTWFKNGEYEAARQCLIFCGHKEYNLNQILNVIFNKADHYYFHRSVEKTDFIDFLKNTYIETEMQYQYACEKVVNYLKKKKQKGHKIYIVSDFYCNKEILKTWLDNLKIGSLFDDIFVSCDFGCTKNSGKLYKAVLKKLGLKSVNVKMMGDNLWADVLSPLKYRIFSKHIKIKLPKTLAKQTKFETPKIYEEIFNSHPDFYNYSNFAFPLYVFIKRLAEALSYNDVKNVFFFSREGLFMKRLFDEYVSSNNLKIVSHYFYVSRNSVLVAGLKNLKEEDFSLLLRETANMISGKSFLLSLDFSNDEISAIQKEIKTSLKTFSFNFSKSKTFKKLKSSKTFVKIYDRKRLEQKDSLDAYIKSFGVDIKKEGFHIVDVGWKGTSQDCLDKYFDKNIDIFGYYLGCNKPTTNTNSVKYGLLYSKNMNCAKFKRENDIYHKNIHIYEHLLRAGHNRVAGYKKTDDGVEIEFANNEQNEKVVFDKIIKPMQDQIFEKFTKICNADKENFAPIETICLKMYLITLKNLSKQDFDWLMASQSSHYDTYARVGYCVKPIMPSLRQAFLKMRFKNIYRSNYKKIKNRNI